MTDALRDALKDAPTPLPAEGVWSGNAADLPNWDAMPRRNRRRRRRSHYPIWFKYLGWCVGLAALVTVGQIAYHAMRSDPRDSTVFALRQLRSSVLRPNEKLRSAVNVWQRPPIDYFRATRGILVLTDAPGDTLKPDGGRLIYLGLQPRDPLSPPDAPPTFDVREWPVDTLVDVRPTRTLFLIASALRIIAPSEQRITLGMSSSALKDADGLRAQLDRKYTFLRQVGNRRREERRARDRAAVAAQYEGRRAWYHTVRRGEAIASIARLYATTPEALRSLNGLVGDRIRIGQTLLVKPITKDPVPTPPGATPEQAPPPRAVVAPTVPRATPVPARR
ncbi:MAG: LysM peptidoglycan-binding domain-containing protein [Gemmatimonadaceae bacterium]|nr:LysM peptidoglycan-binding domain-containing protein [Gemmatimonadaceae bacterium]